MSDKKHEIYNALELKKNEWYKYGNKIVQFIEDSGKKLESYKDVWSHVYKFKEVVLEGETQTFQNLNLTINPKFKCFKELKLKELEELIKEEKRKIRLTNERIFYLEEIIKTSNLLKK